MNENKTMKTNEKVWSPNATQQLFLETVKANPGKTLEELSAIAGVKFTSGCINTLAAKNLVNNTEKKKVARVVYKEVSVYNLVD